jgi:hypothetical protein
MLEHVAAMLGVPAPSSVPLREQTARTPPAAQVVVHWTGTASQRLDAGDLVAKALAVSRSAQVDVTCMPHVVTEPGGVVARVFAREGMTADGYHLAPAWQAVVSDWMHAQVHTSGSRGVHAAADR